MTPPLVRLGAGELVATFAEARGEVPALLLLHRPGPGEDGTPRRVDLSESPLEELQRDWQECSARGFICIEAHPVSGFDLLLETVREVAARTSGPAPHREIPVANVDPNAILERLARRCFHIRAVLGLDGAATPDQILQAAEFVWTKQKELLKRERERANDAEERGARWALEAVRDVPEGESFAAIDAAALCKERRRR